MDDIAEIRAENERLKKENQELKRSSDKAKIASDNQESFSESQTRFRTIFESSRLGNKIISSDLSILEVNDAMVKLLGYDDKEEIVGTGILDYAPQESHSDWRFLQEKLWQHATPSFSIETTLYRRDKTIIYCQVTSILFQDNGETLGYTIIEDISEKYALRRQREEFISIASHELRTPITSLSATVQLLNRMLKAIPSVPKNLLDMAASIERYSLKLNVLVGDLLYLTKIEQGQLALNKTRFKIADLINGCCSHIRLEGKYQLKFVGDHQLEMVADEHKIDQVLVNLVNNAVKYAPDSMEIIMKVQHSGNSIKVIVTDQGRGISNEHKASLFERYYRVDHHDLKRSGLGLGLYICAEIVKRHGGQIGVNSTIGQGASFWFTIPFMEPD